METVEAKTILSRRSGEGDWLGADYGMNLYRGCSHGCIYCDTRSDCYRIDHFPEVRAKRNALDLLERELSTRRKRGIVATGAMSDPYNPMEREHELTRGGLKLLRRYGFGATVHTKSDLVTRDIDLIAGIAAGAPAAVYFTITTSDDGLSRKIEPGVAESSKRFRALGQIAGAGILTGVLIWPVLPFITDTDDNISALVARAAEEGAGFVLAHFGVTLRQNQRAYYFQQLDRLFPGLKEEYVGRYGDRYECLSPGSGRLRQTLEEECRRYGLLFRMKDVREALRRQHRARQLPLF